MSISDFTGASKVRLPTFALLIILGTAAGFAAGLWLWPSNPFPEPVNWHAQFHEGVVYESPLSKGWGSPRWSGVPAKGTKSTITIRLQDTAPTDLLHFVVELEWLDKPDTETREIGLSVNGDDIGKIIDKNSDKIYRYHFLVSKSSDKHTQVFQVRLQSKKQPAFLLRQIWLRDVHSLQGDRGHIDYCNEKSISGWAIADGLGSPLKVRLSSREPTWIVPNVERKDLAPIGLSVFSGYKFNFESHLEPGASVRATFPNGRELEGSPCNIE